MICGKQTLPHQFQPYISLNSCLNELIFYFTITDPHSRDLRRNHRHSHPQNALSSASLFGPFGLHFGGGELMDDFFNPGRQPGFTSFSTLSSFNGATPSSANVKRTSTSTRFVNGKKITTKK